MPSKSERIRIIGTEFDRRKKLNEKSRQKIAQLYNDGLSQTQIARQFNVDRATVADVLFPERKEKRRQQSIEYSRKRREHMKNSPTLRQELTDAVRNHRRYKQELYKKGLIKYTEQEGVDGH